MHRITTEPSEIEVAIRSAVAASRGHFVYESGHHGDVWLDLDALFVDARRVRGWAAVLADEVIACQPELVCGPLTGGAFVAQPLAAEIGAGFVFAERLVTETGTVQYLIPESLRIGPDRDLELVEIASETCFVVPDLGPSQLGIRLVKTGNEVKGDLLVVHESENGLPQQQGKDNGG